VKLWVARRANGRNWTPSSSARRRLSRDLPAHLASRPVAICPANHTWTWWKLARRHPAVPIICGHTAAPGAPGSRDPRREESLSDLAGSDPTAGYVEMAVRELGAERVIYGSMWAVAASRRSWESDGARVPQAAK